MFIKSCNCSLASPPVSKQLAFKASISRLASAGSELKVLAMELTSEIGLLLWSEEWQGPQSLLLPVVQISVGNGY